MTISRRQRGAVPIVTRTRQRGRVAAEQIIQTRQRAPTFRTITPTWRPAKSSRNGKPVDTRYWSIHLDGLVVTVRDSTTEHDPEVEADYYLDCRPWFEGHPLGVDDVEGAQAEALQLVKERLRLVIAAFVKELGRG